MNIKQNIVLHNKFEVKVVEEATGKVKQTAVAYNVITNDYFKTRLNMFSSDVSMSNGIAYIGIGTGAGVPAITDTVLFTPLFHRSSTLVETHYEYPTSYIVRQIKINADEYNNTDITEVGLEAYYTVGLWSSAAYKLCTHAMLQDSEGNQIAIHKTDVDVVYINATFYCTFTAAGFGDNGLYPLAADNVLVKWLLLGNTNYTVYTNRFPLQHSSELASLYQFSKSYNFSSGVGDFASLTYELPVITILDAEWNNHVVKNIGIPGIGAFQFPDPSVFPDYAVEHLVLGEGDGENRSFNIKCPYIKKGSVRVFVNNDELASSDFVADCESNCVDTRENYYTAGMNAQMDSVSFGDVATRSPSTSYLYQDPLSWQTYPVSGYRYPSSCQVKDTTPIWIDFGEAKECNQLRIDNNKINTSYVDKLVIEHSDDNENWTAVEYTRDDFAYNSSYYFYTWKWAMTTARYWRVYIPGYTWTYYFYYSTTLGTRDGTSIPKSSFFLGKSVPGLVLNTAPAAGATVEASYKLELPFKTENNILRMTCSVQLQRG